MENKEEDMRAAKLALARKKLKDHQEKKNVPIQKVETIEVVSLENKPQEVNNIETEFTNTLHNKEIKSHQFSDNLKFEDMDINVTEILISNKRNLEAQVTELEFKLNQLQSAHSLEITNHSATKQQLDYLQNEVKHLKDNYVTAADKILQLNKNVEQLTTEKNSLSDQNNDLTKQLELTKTILTAKETDNSSLRSNLIQIQNELDATKLQLQQLNSGSSMSLPNGTSNSKEEKEFFARKIKSLEQQLNVTQKEKDQINMHYETYVGELNEQLKTVLIKNEDLSKKVESLAIREISLVEQIGEMEIRIQNFHANKLQAVEDHSIPTPQESEKSVDEINLYNKTQEELQAANKKCMELEQLYARSESKVIELQEIINANSTHEDISISKLTADITSDKIAAQRATEQNKKLKTSMQELEEAFVKMTRDKLELTEKLAAEKYLNRELTIKLAEIEEKSKDMHTKLMAKDEEMIRLQMTYRDLEKELEKITSQIKLSEKSLHEAQIANTVEFNEENTEVTNSLIETNKSNVCLHDISNDSMKDGLHDKQHSSIPQEDAMVKLQERFMKIMGDVADLSDEKHRLEHIILQLQNETDTICEYVALYQQQRSLLKKRDEERTAQVKLFQVECERLKSQLEELSGILLRFAEDAELATYFQVESRLKDMEKVRSLLQNLKSNSLVDPKNSLQLSSVYPCNCCSGNLIDV